MARDRDSASAKPARPADAKPASAKATDPKAAEPAHRWAIDQVEEGTASVEQDGDHVYAIPRYLVPPDARDGDVLAVTVMHAAAGEVTVSVKIDHAASAPPPAKGSPKKRPASNDPGGDIIL